MHNVWLALWFFVPGGAANAAPVFAAKLPLLRRWQTPLDCGRSFGRQRIFGANKTWRGLLAGIVLATAVLWGQRYLFTHTGWARTVAAPLDYAMLPLVPLGVLFGLGTLCGDAIESFFKRRRGVSPGQSWFPFDQTDYIIGGVIATYPIVRLATVQYIWLLVIWLALHLLGSYVGFLLKLKTRPI